MKTAAVLRLRGYECTVKGTDWSRIVNATSRSKARYRYWLDVHEAWDSVKIMDIEVKGCGAPHTSERLQNTAKYRGVPDLRAGEVVTVKYMRSRGWIIDSDSGANFKVEFFDGEYAGQRGSVHVSELERVA